MTNTPAIFIFAHFFIFLVLLVVALGLFRVNGAFLNDLAHSVIRFFLHDNTFRHYEAILLPFDHNGDEFFDQEGE
jgi:hypothetical protein